MSEADQQSILPEDELAEAFAQIEALSEGSSEPAAAAPAAADPAAEQPAEAATTQPEIPENDIAAALDELAAAAEQLSSESADSAPPDAPTPAPTPDNADDSSGATDAADPAPPADENTPASDAAADEPSETDTGTPAPAEPDGAADASATLARPPAGDVSFSNALVADDELAAALAEIESLKEDEAASIPSLDDDGPGVFTKGSASLSPGDQQESAAKTGGAGGLSADDELAAALAEIETLSTQEKTPGTTQVKQAPAPAAAPQAGPPSEAPPSPAGDDPAAEQPKGDAPAKRIRFKIKRKPGEDAQDADGYKPPAKDGGQAGAVALPETPLLKRVVRILDRLLDALNRPFARLSATQRNLIGYAAAATLVTSLLAALLMPKALPYRDATTFLREKAAAVRAADAQAHSTPKPHADTPAEPRP